jgi:hypothetical protein
MPEGVLEKMKGIVDDARPILGTSSTPAFTLQSESEPEGKSVELVEDFAHTGLAQVKEETDSKENLRSKETLKTLKGNPMDDMVSELSDKLEECDEILDDLKELENLPKNVSVSKTGVCVSEWPIDVLYN